jgi:peptide-methionine (S)-S-oxide reductase
MVFWNTHNPTTRNKQGNDVGTQYRSIILYTSQSQKEIAEDSREQLNKTPEFEGKIVTEIVPLLVFYEAESYHKDYYEKNQEAPYCSFVITPKLKHLREKFSDKLKK